MSSFPFPKLLILSAVAGGVVVAVILLLCFRQPGGSSVAPPLGTSREVSAQSIEQGEWTSRRLEVAATASPDNVAAEGEVADWADLGQPSDGLDDVHALISDWPILPPEYVDSLENFEAGYLGFLLGYPLENVGKLSEVPSSFWAPWPEEASAFEAILAAPEPERASMVQDFIARRLAGIDTHGLYADPRIRQGFRDQIALDALEAYVDAFASREAGRREAGEPYRGLNEELDSIRSFVARSFQDPETFWNLADQFTSSNLTYPWSDTRFEGTSTRDKEGSKAAFMGQITQEWVHIGKQVWTRADSLVASPGRFTFLHELYLAMQFP